MPLKNSNKYRFSFKSFFAGLAVGIAVIIGLFFGYLLISNSENLNFTNHIIEVKPVDKEILPPLKKQTYYATKDTYNMIVDSVYYWQKWDEIVEKPGYREMDSLFIDSIIKKYYADSIAYAKLNEDKIIIENDKLIASKSIIAIVQNFNSQSADSSEKYLYSESRFKVEFWKSPINFVGQKRLGNLVVVFGKIPEKINNFVQIDENLYLKDNSNWYLINNKQEFSDFVPLKSATLIERIEMAENHKKSL